MQQLALADGVLGGDPATGCLWFERDGERTPLVVEHDSAHLDVEATPAVVRDGDQVRAELGQDVELGGGFADLAAAVPGCSGGGAPFVADLLRASPPE